MTKPEEHNNNDKRERCALVGVKCGSYVYSESKGQWICAMNDHPGFDIKVCREAVKIATAEKMNSVFKEAIAKVNSRHLKPGNTAEPWNDCDTVWLRNRLIDEISEWYNEIMFPNGIVKKKDEIDVEKEKGELLDIINLATFVYLSLKRKDGSND